MSSVTLTTRAGSTIPVRSASDTERGSARHADEDECGEQPTGHDSRGAGAGCREPPIRAARRGHLEEARDPRQQGRRPPGRGGFDPTQVGQATEHLGEVRDGAGRQCHECHRHHREQHDVEGPPAYSRRYLPDSSNQVGAEQRSTLRSSLDGDAVAQIVDTVEALVVVDEVTDHQK